MNQPSRRSAVSGSPTRDFCLTAAATAWWIALIWNRNYAEFSSQDIIAFLSHASVVLLAEYLLLVLSTRFLSTRWSVPVNALFCTFNVYTIVFLHSGMIASLSVPLALAFLLACTLAFAVVFVAAHRNSFAFRAATSVVLLLTVLNLSSYAWSIRTQQQAIDAVTLPARLTIPAFSEKPNVYIVLFDAMIPQSIARRFLEIEDELEYSRALREAGSRILENVFSDGNATRPTMNSLVALDLEHFRTIARPTRYLYLIGAIPGALYEVFKRNGYQTQVIYSNNYFGSPSMAKLDHYGIVNERGVCDFVDSKHAFLAYCLPAISSFWGSVLGAGHSGQSFPEILFERIAITGASQAPWLTISYISKPKHTPKTFDPYKPDHWTAYAKEFEQAGAVRAAEYLRKLFEVLRVNDPGAVLVVLGDHGAWLSRGISVKAGISGDGPLDETEIFLDRHAVVGAVHPASFCPEYFQGPISLTQIARDVVRCLAGGEDPLPSDYRPGADRYARHVYE